MVYPINVHQSDGVQIFEIDGNLDFDSPAIGALPSAVEQATSRPGTQLLLKLSDSARVDSTGLGTIVSAMRQAHHNGSDFKLYARSPHLRDMMRVTRLDTVISTVNSEAEALEQFRAARQVVGPAAPATVPAANPGI